MELKTLQRLVNLISTLIEAVEQHKITTPDLYSRFQNALSREGHFSLLDFIEALTKELNKPAMQLKIKGEDIRKLMLLFPNSVSLLNKPRVKERIQHL
jgi:hypothetical protein